MKVEFTFRNLDSSEAIKNYATSKLAKMDRYLHEPGSAAVTTFVDKHLQCVDITVSSGSHVYSGSHSSEDMYASIDLATDKVDKQIRRAKATQTSKRRRVDPEDTAHAGKRGR